MKKHIRTAIAGIAKLGCTEIELHQGGHHPYLAFSFQGRELTVTVSTTPRSPSSAVNNILQDVRRVCGIKGEPSAPREHHHKRHSQQRPRLPRPSGVVIQDNREILKNHPLYGR